MPIVGSRSSTPPCPSTCFQTHPPRRRRTTARCATRAACPAARSAGSCQPSRRRAPGAPRGRAGAGASAPPGPGRGAGRARGARMRRWARALEGWSRGRRGVWRRGVVEWVWGARSSGEEGRGDSWLAGGTRIRPARVARGRREESRAWGHAWCLGTLRDRRRWCQACMHHPESRASPCPRPDTHTPHPHATPAHAPRPARHPPVQGRVVGPDGSRGAGG